MAKGKDQGAMLEEPKQEVLSVKLVQEEKRNPNLDKYPLERDLDKRPKRRYKFSHLQQPGTEFECTPGVTVVKNNGKLGTVHEKYKIMDGDELDLPVDIVERWRSLMYLEEGRKRPRFHFEEV